MVNENELAVFNNEELGLSVRCMIIDGKEYFVAKDIADALGYQKTRNAILAHCKHALKQGVPTNGGVQEMVLINEGDMYRLIIKSKLPLAQKFEEWVMDYVLPQIRKTGGYIPVKEEDDEKTIMAKALRISQKTLEEKDSIIAAKNNLIQEQSKTVAFVKLVSNTKGTISMKKFADILGIKGLGRNTLYELLRELKIVLPDSTEPYRRYIDSGHVVAKLSASKNGKANYSTRVTTKGQEYLTKKILKHLGESEVYISNTLKLFTKEIISDLNKSQEECNAMLLNPLAFKDEWLGLLEVAEKIAEEEDTDEMQVIVKEIGSLLD